MGTECLGLRPLRTGVGGVSRLWEPVTRSRVVALPSRARLDGCPEGKRARQLPGWVCKLLELWDSAEGWRRGEGLQGHRAQSLLLAGGGVCHSRARPVLQGQLRIPGVHARPRRAGQPGHKPVPTLGHLGRHRAWKEGRRARACPGCTAVVVNVCTTHAGARAGPQELTAGPPPVGVGGWVPGSESWGKWTVSVSTLT